MQPHSTFIFELVTGASDPRPVYLAGNFNEWRAPDERFKMLQVQPGQFRLEVKVPSHAMVEYKYTRGDWQDVELDPQGNETHNRIAPSNGGVIIDKVPRWNYDGLGYNPELLPHIQVLSDQFEIPQLIKTRRIGILLPYDYYTSNKRYPVLYLQDGQNLYEEFAPYGTWGLDKKLATMSELGFGDLIVVAIDHAEDQRIKEYTPTRPTRLGIGDGEAYASFIAETLKPHVDHHFRTIPDRVSTGIGGSSMGGLISLYAGLLFPEVFGKLMIFSPSLWVAPNLYQNKIQLFNRFKNKIYLYAGGNEGKGLINNMERLLRELKQHGVDQEKLRYRYSFAPEGHHNEYFWGREFPKAMHWLFYSQ